MESKVVLTYFLVALLTVNICGCLYFVTVEVQEETIVDEEEEEEEEEQTDNFGQSSKVQAQPVPSEQLLQAPSGNLGKLVNFTYTSNLPKGRILPHS